MRRNARIDMIRGVAILLVLLHHFSIAYSLPASPLGMLLTPGVVRAVVRNGNYGVTLFFAVSGFLITSNARTRWGALSAIPPQAFYRLRIARIVPCLLLLLGMVTLLGATGLPIFQSHVDPGLVDLAALTFWMNVLIAHIGWSNYALGVLWSLSVEEMFYLTFPIVALLLRRDRSLAAFWLLVAAIGPLYRAAHQNDEAGFLFAYFAAFDGIAIGCCTALLAGRVSVPRWIVPLAAASMAALYLAASIVATNIWGVSAMALGTAILLIDAVAHTGNRQPGRLGRALAWPGRLSYELYLFHLIVLGLMRTALPPAQIHGWTVPLLLALFLVLSALLAQAIARFYAEPLNRRVRGPFRPA